ncbi:MAG TPA: diaminopimelate epimerase [Mycobacteriales bacterium]|nr:diaminopimelate epimerase [Mycobacteriales bacterium]
MRFDKGLRFIKGQGTGNDFVLLPDPPEDLSGELVRRLCDRRTGIGGDGVLAVRRSADAAAYFMDYRNADGSIAETCGNGIRVFARYLVTGGLAQPGTIEIQTRAGIVQVDVPADGGDITVAMGVPIRLADAKVTIGQAAWPAFGYDIGNPHLVVLDAGDLDALDLTHEPAVDPGSAFPDGVNVELLAPAGPRHLRMRVFERGVGETDSCGSGACMAAVAAMEAAGERSTYVVDVPGGRLSVTWRDDDVVTLSGPAILVASGEVDPQALT